MQIPYLALMGEYCGRDSTNPVSLPPVSGIENKRYCRQLLRWILLPSPFSKHYAWLLLMTIA
jgi:hypothetical protein